MLLNDKVVLVVGAGGLLGSKIVETVVSEGGKVVAADVKLESVEPFADKYGRKTVISSEIDITDKHSIETLFKKAENQWGGIDGAVNTAYPRNSNYGRKVFSVTYDDFCENVSLHLGGYFLFMQQCAEYSVRRKKPFSLVNMSSIYGTIAPKFDIYQGTEMTMPVEYAAIKSAVQHLSLYFTAALKKENFRVNCVSPGGIYNGQNLDFVARYNERCVSKGMLDSDDIVDSVVFLLSDNARFVYGQNLVIDDGFSI